MDAFFNILLAEDSADDVFLLQEAFKKAGAGSRLHAVNDGLGVLAYLKGEGAYADRAVYPYPDFLLLDLNMPRLSGLEVLERVRQDARCGRLVVYVLSASAREADVQRAYELRANGYVVKPARLDDLVAWVAALHAWHRFACLPPPPVETPAAAPRQSP